MKEGGARQRDYFAAQQLCAFAAAGCRLLYNFKYSRRGVHQHHDN